MKLSIVILSRSRPLGLTGVVMSLWRLRSGKHDLDFVIGADEDDFSTLEAAARLSDEIPPANLLLRSGPRPSARGALENEMLSRCRNSDAVTMLTDRTFCITPGWDDAIARAVTERPKRVMWWTCPDDLVCVMPIIPRAWLDACDGRWSPEIFPFWFDDTWNQQIDLMINGMPSLKVLTSYAGLRGATARGREFAFWIDVFNDTLPLRIEQAKRMASALGVEWKERPEVMQYIANHYRALRDGAAKMEETFGDKSDPGEGYFLAKARAQKLTMGEAA